MMKGVMMSAILSVADTPVAEQRQSRDATPAPAAGTQVVTALVQAGKQAFSSPYTVAVKKIEPIAGSNQVRVMLFVTGEDEPAHDFTETGNQVARAFLDVGMRAHGSGASMVTVGRIEAVEGGDDDTDDTDDTDET